MPVCLIDNKEFPDDKSLHLYIWRTHRTKIEDYYKKYYPKYDLLTGEMIDFKNKEFYFSNLFNTRANLIKYVLNKKEKAKIVITDLFNNRISYKKARYAFSQIELRSLLLPSVTLVERCGLNYNEITTDLGLENRFDYNLLPMPCKRNLNIIVDSREQMPLEFSCKSFVNKLDFGDYTASKELYAKIFIERKSLSDFIGTLSQGYERFCKEIQRCNDLNGYLIVVVEDTVDNALNFKLKKVKAKPEFIFHRLREISQNYKNIQFVFSENRVKSSKLIELILSNGENSKNIDWQYLLDSKKIKLV